MIGYLDPLCWIDGHLALAEVLEPAEIEAARVRASRGCYRGHRGILVSGLLGTTTGFTHIHIYI